MRAGLLAVVLSFVTVSSAYAQEQFYLSQVANGTFEGGSFRTTFVLFNTTDSNVTASLNLTRDNGTPLVTTIETLGTGSEFTLTLPAGATRILQTDGNGTLVTGAATVTTAARIGISSVFTVFDNEGRYVTEAGVGTAGLQTEFVLPVDTTGMFNTGLALFNPNSADASITLLLRRETGEVAGQTTKALAAKGHLASFIAGPGQLFPDQSNLRGTLRVQSSVPLAALGLRQNQTPLSYTSLPVVPADSSGLVQNLAHVANGTFTGGSFKTSFLLFSLSATTANVQLALTRDDGTPLTVTIPDRGTAASFEISLPAQRSVFLQTDGTGGLVQGAATITSDVPIGAAAVFTVFGSQGAFQTEAGVGDSPSRAAATFPVDLTGAFDTGIAFFNPGTDGATITLRLLNAEGVVTRSSTTLELAPHAHTARFVSQLFPGTANFRGSVSVSSSEEVAALTLRQNAAPLSYTTLPVASGFSSGTTGGSSLLTRTRTGVNATAGNLTLNETLPAGSRLSGQVGLPGQVRAVLARHEDGTVHVALVDPETGRYSVTLPAGSYRLTACFQPEGVPPGADVTRTYADPAPVQVSGDTSRDIALPSIPLVGVAGTLTGLTSLPSGTGVSVVFTSIDYTVEGRFEVNSSGGYQGALPGGTYQTGVSIDSIEFAPFQRESLALFNLGSRTIGATPVTVDLAIPPTARVSGTVRAPWLGQFAFGISVTASDRSAPQITAPACVLPNSDSTASADPRYQMILARDRTYDMQVTVPLLDGSRRLGTVTFTRGVVNLGGDTVFDFDIPAIPAYVVIAGRVTDGQGRGVSGVTVGAFTQSVSDAADVGFAGSATTDTGGNYTMRVLSGSDYIVTFIPPAAP